MALVELLESVSELVLCAAQLLPCGTAGVMRWGHPAFLIFVIVCPFLFKIFFFHLVSKTQVTVTLCGCDRTKAVFSHAELAIPVSISLSCCLVFSFSRVFCLLILSFSPIPCNNNRSFNPLTISHYSCMQTRSHIHCTPFLLLPLPFFLCHTHINPPSIPTPQQISPVPFTHSHSLDCKTTWQNTRLEASNPTIHVGGRRLQKSYWQNAMNETERMAEFQTQENCSVPKL